MINQKRCLASIIVCTKNRPDDLERCLNSLQMYSGQDEFEVLVVDDLFASISARKIVEKYPGCRYFQDHGCGQGEAKNVGIEAAFGEYIIFTDDDVVILPGWIENLLKNFDNPMVGYVSGQVKALEIKTDAQKIFEDLAVLSKATYRKVFDTGFFSKFRLRGVPVHLISMGANSAIPKRVLDIVGLHDPLFGVGSATEGSEAGELCYRILQKGYIAVFDPAALVLHRHPVTRQNLRKRFYTYGKADTVTHTKFLLEFGDIRSLADLMINRPYRQIRKILESVLGIRRTPFDLIFCEIIGNWIGPWVYLFARYKYSKKNF